MAIRYQMAYRNISENFNQLSRAHERCRQPTDRQTAERRTGDISEREGASYYLLVVVWCH